MIARSRIADNNMLSRTLVLVSVVVVVRARFKAP